MLWNIATGSVALKKKDKDHRKGQELHKEFILPLLEDDDDEDSDVKIQYNENYPKVKQIIFIITQILEEDFSFFIDIMTSQIVMDDS